jgi:nucleotide-binding universal stress UspA family protein
MSKPKGLKECIYWLKSGKVIDVLNECARDEKVDLIVIGATGASNFDKRYIGSKAVSIVENAKCNVLCVPENRNYEGIDRIVYATDYQEEDKIAIQLLVLLAQQMGASIDILHISHHNDTIDKAIYEDYIREMKAFVDYDKLSFNREVYHHISEGLENYMKKSGSDLLVLLYKRHDFFENLFRNSLTKHLSNFADFPFMVMKL